MENCILRWCARCANISNGTINDRQSASRSCKPTNQGIIRYRVRNDVNLLAKHSNRMRPVRKLEYSVRPQWWINTKAIDNSNIWSSSKWRKTAQTRDHWSNWLKWRETSDVSRRLCAMTRNNSTAHVCSKVRNDTTLWVHSPLGAWSWTSLNYRLFHAGRG